MTGKGDGVSFLCHCSVINRAIREHGLSVTNVSSGTFIPDDEVNEKRLPIPTPDVAKIRRNVWHWMINQAGLLL